MKIPQRNTFLWAKRDDTFLVLQENAPILFEFNTTSGKIWELIDGNRTVDEIANLISNNYPDLDKNIILDDLNSFLKGLEENDLITYKDINLEEGNYV